MDPARWDGPNYVDCAEVNGFDVEERRLTLGQKRGKRKERMGGHTT